MTNYFEKLQAGLDVDSSLENITAPETGGATSKLDTLAANKNKKLQNLGSRPALDMLTGDAFYQEMGRLAQQPTNNLRPEEVQYALGYAAGDQILTDDQGRYKFKTDSVTGQYATDDQGEWIKDYEVGDGRNVYIDSNVEGDKKLGLAREDKGFLGRYTPDWKQYVPGLDGYGWEPGPKGVTPEDGAEMDITTDYGAATDLEKIVHSNVGQIKNRSIGQGPVDALDEYYYGSGKTEYTKDTAPMWNVGYEDDGKALEAGTPLPGESRMDGVFEEPDEDSDTKLSKTLKAFGTSLTKELAVDTVDWVLEATNLGDLGNEEEKAKMVNGWYNYSPKDLQDATKKVSLLTSEAIAQAKKGNYALAADLVAEGAVTAAMEPELGASSLGTIAAWAAPGAWLTKGSKLAKTQKTADAITATGKAKGVAIGSKEGLKTLAKQQSGYTAAAIGNVNDQYEAWVENNGGVELDGMEKIEYFATRLPLQMFNQNLDAITAVGIIKSPSMLKDLGKAIVNASEKEFGKTAMGIGKSIAGVAAAMPKEAAQEYSQRMMELFNERYGSEKFKELDTFFKFMVDEGNIEEAAVDAVMGAGGAVQFKAVGAVVPGAKKVLGGKTKSVEEITKENEAATTKNVEAKFETYEGVEVDSGLGVPSSAEVVKEAKDSTEAVQVMTGIKNKVLNENFEIENGEIVGLKEGSSRKAVNSWVEDYVAFSADAEGNLPSGVQKEVDILRSALTGTTTATEVAQKQMQGVELTDVEEAYAAKYSENVQAKMKEIEVDEDVNAVEKAVQTNLDKAVEGKSTEDTIKEVERRTDIVLESLEIKDEKVRETVRTRAREQVLNTIGISGFAMDTELEVDEEILEATLQESAGLKAKEETRKANQGARSIVVGLFTNEDIDDVMKGEGVNESKVASDVDNTKLRARVLRRLDPMTTKNVTDTLREVDSKVAKGVDKNEDKAKTYLQGDVRGNLKRLMLVGMNTINASTESDTDGRRMTESDTSMLADKEYYAGMSGTMEQIGKDYAMSYGLKVKGSPEKLAKVHRDLGRLAIEALKDADLVEISSDNIMSRAGNVQTVTNEKLADSNSKKGVRTYKGVDKETGKDVLLVQDKGIRLKDANAMYDENDLTGTRFKYESKSGDAVKRVVKLILPNAERVPSNEKSKGDVKVAEGIEVSEGTRKKVKDIANKKLGLKEGTLKDVVYHLKYTNESTDGGLAAQRKNTVMNTFLGLKESGSEILEAGESGSNMSRLDNLIGILDNADTLEKGVYYTFQIDINNRMTIRETVANYQGDKVFARNLMTAGEYKISTEPEKEIFVDYLYDELGLDGDKESAINEIAEYYEEILASSDGAADIIDYVAGGMAKGQPLAGAAKKGGIAILSMLEAAKNFKDAKGGDITTEFMVEKDASASGVFNTLMNLSGMNPEAFRDTLQKLGVRFNGESIDPSDEVDAYNILGNLIREGLDSAKGKSASKASEMNLKAVQDMVNVIQSDKILRDLAKYPIMTWFYAAEKDSIIENMSTEMTKVLLDNALNGDVNTIKYLGEKMGIPEPTADKIRAVKPLSKEHKALRDELAAIGGVYYGNLEKAFPDVAKRKKEMNGYYKYLDDNGKVAGEDYWEGRVRTAVGAMDGSDSKMSLYQWKNVAMDLSAAEKIEKGITTDDESLTLVTMMARMSNQTSMMALMAHSIDATQAINGLAAVPSDYGIMSVHDGFYGRPQDLINFQTEAEKVTKNVAIEYDMANEMALAMRDTASSMREAAKEDGANSTELNRKAGLLEQKATEIEAVNNPVMDAKVDLLKDAETTLFGKEGYVDAETGTKPEREVQTVVEEESSTEEAGQSEGKTVVATMKKEMEKGLLAFDVETDLGPDNNIHQLGYYVDGKPYTVDIKYPFLAEKGDKNYEEYKAAYEGKAYSKLYMSYDEVVKKSKSPKSKDTLAEAVLEMLDRAGDANVLGFNNRNSDKVWIVNGLTKESKSNKKAAEALERLNKVKYIDLRLMLRKYKEELLIPTNPNALKEEGTLNEYLLAFKVNTKGDKTHEAGYDAKNTYRIAELLAEGKVPSRDTLATIGNFTTEFIKDVLGNAFPEMEKDIAGVNIVPGSEKKIKDLIKKNPRQGDKLLELLAEGRSFYDPVTHTVVIGAQTLTGVNELTGEEATNQQLADVVLHEVEHAVSDNYIDRESSKGGAIEKEYEVLKRILEKAVENGTKSRNRRTKYILGLAEQGDYKQAVKELVAVSREADSDKAIEELGRVAGLKRVVAAIIEKIREYFETKTVDELVEEADTHTIKAAVENIQEKARAAKGPIQAEDATISELKEEINIC